MTYTAKFVILNILTHLLSSFKDPLPYCTICPDETSQLIKGIQKINIGSSYKTNSTTKSPNLGLESLTEKYKNLDIPKDSSPSTFKHPDGSTTKVTIEGGKTKIECIPTIPKTKSN